MQKSPLPIGYTESLARELLEPIKRGESAFVRWFPGHGKSVLLQQIFPDKKLLQVGLGSFYQRFIFVKVDGYLFVSSSFAEYLVYVYEQLISVLFETKLIKSREHDPHIPLSSAILTVKRIIEQCHQVVEAGREVVFIVDAIDDFSREKLQEMFTAWEYIVESNRERIHTHINVNRRDILDDVITQSGLIQNIVSVSLPDKDARDYFVNYYAKEWGVSLTQTLRTRIYDVCGYDPVILKEAIRIIHKLGDKVDLLDQETLKIKAKNNFLQLGKLEQETIASKVKTGKVTPHLKKTAQDLVRSHFWDANYSVPHVLARIVVDPSELKELRINPKSQTLFFGDINLHQKLSESEHQILERLFKKMGKVVSRDEIAESIWGKKMLDEYSDWAIDKAISRLRTKLAQLSFYYRIETKKKEGFSLEI